MTMTKMNQVYSYPKSVLLRTKRTQPPKSNYLWVRKGFQGLVLLPRLLLPVGPDLVDRNASRSHPPLVSGEPHDFTRGAE